MSTLLFLSIIFGIIFALACVDAYCDNWCKKNGYDK